ncbi:hypothetical protein [Mycobacterium gordonae]|uniref:hypothetical protein n=1 Tax=Mycobacterium gordonae TaxID=1778 RepID=UPI0012EA4F26|nr:hypothetical protein [Mycobacterium gordonae]MCV7007243.1 hypothetical protein [Mycobacterium gordonae]
MTEMKGAVVSSSIGPFFYVILFRYSERLTFTALKHLTEITDRYPMLIGEGRKLRGPQ